MYVSMEVLSGIVWHLDTSPWTRFDHHKVMRKGLDLHKWIWRNVKRSKTINKIFKVKFSVLFCWYLLTRRSLRGERKEKRREYAEHDYFLSCCIMPCHDLPRHDISQCSSMTIYWWFFLEIMWKKYIFSKKQPFSLEWHDMSCHVMSGYVMALRHLNW